MTTPKDKGDWIEAMAAAYEEERAKYIGGTVYYPHNGAAFRGCMEKALATNRLADGWRPIETAPKDGEIIIMYGKSKHAGFDTVGTGHWYRQGKTFVWDNYLGDEPRPPTHWMPLPSSPKETT